ncbi:methylmalonyl-CoA mutase family protein [Aneurinibacillus sp. Ricciae_BoGa-3]|uniref:methylmalonyl-CoA mutase family protein n=1 Tax=Aneurinibacillus sp. Ricciae_BoGa-3 TaxID=3022697 RepID=UPI00233FDD05|nr:methylmalonyl-CoA mutase family protein [Aneurinibacillus sp. Ricciae_BoGa-3]WCK55951.1 methylmalonyl-CoA mutase family protein [Aneurinibacillus sp. Ricciae_BoGa-3]
MENVEKKREQLTVEEEYELFNAFPHPTYQEWRELTEKSLKGASFEGKLVTHTYEGIDLQPMYRMEDIQNLPYLSSLPGSSPYVRSANLTGHVEKPWEVAQELSAPTPQLFNEAAQQDIARGQTALTIVLDKATRSGRDADVAPQEDVGAAGLSLSSLSDMRAAMHGIDLQNIPLYVQGEGAFTFLLLTAAYLKAETRPYQNLHGCVGEDPLGTLVAEGRLPGSAADAYDRLAGMTAWALENAPDLHTIAVQGAPYHNGGASAVQEIAYALASGAEYIRELQARGLAVDDIAPRFLFSFSIGSNLFMEIAKLRAARSLWATIVQAFGGAEEAQKMRIHARTSAWTKTVHDPYVNMLRGTAEAFAGIVGGADSLHVSPFDEAIRPSDEFSRRIARNTQIILQQEANLSRVIDPAGGSWYVETLTDSIAQNAWTLFQKVEEQGCMYQALVKGFPQSEIAEVAAARRKNIARRKDKFVGTNMYPNLSEKPLVHNGDAQRFMQSQRIENVRKERQNANQTMVKEALAKINRNEGQSPKSMVEVAIAAIEAGATAGEVSAAFLKQGEAVRVMAIPAWRGADMFEQLRSNAARYREETGAAPAVFLANLGSIPQHKARADFASGFFEVGGFEIIKNNGFATAKEAADAAISSGAPIVIICGMDDMYPEAVPAIASGIKQTVPDCTVLLAGLPAAEQGEAYRLAGVDDFIHVRANCYEMLENLQKVKGIAR